MVYVSGMEGKTPIAEDVAQKKARLAKEFEVEEFLEQNGYLPDWSPARIKLAKIFGHTGCELGICSVVIFNLVVVVAETDFRVQHKNDANASSPFIDVSSTLLLLFYTAELLTRLFTFRWMYFKSGANIMDFTIVSVDWAFIPLSGVVDDLMPVSFLRIFRLARLARSQRVMRMSPELSLLLNGLRDVAKTLLWGGLMILLMLTIWSILAVEFIHPVNLEVAELTSGYDGCDRCVRAYESVFQSNLTLFQSLIAGDSWGLVTIPVMERQPSTAIFFIGVHITVSIGLMNLLLAVIVDRAQQARTNDVKAIEKEEEHERIELKTKLLDTCKLMDDDASGVLTLEELQIGYHCNRDFHLTMKAMDIDEDDMLAVFGIMDEDRGGTVKYEEFVDQVWKMKSTEDHAMLIFMQFQLGDIKHHLTQHLHTIEDQVASAFRTQADQFVDVQNDFIRLSGLTAQVESKADSKQVAASKAGDAEKLQEQPSMSDELVTLRLLTEEMTTMMKQNITSAAPSVGSGPGPRPLSPAPRGTRQNIGPDIVLHADPFAGSRGGGCCSFDKPPASTISTMPRPPYPAGALDPAGSGQSAFGLGGASGRGQFA